MITVRNTDFKLATNDHEFIYQNELTPELDNLHCDFNQSIINEIILWKVNRYAMIDSHTLKILNQIKKDDFELNETLTREVINRLLRCRGIQLPMASTILRFKNPKIYQIIDQRVFRILYPDQTLKINYGKGEKTEGQIDLYIDYLKELKAVSLKLNIPFELSDRILFMADKRLNKKEILQNYGKRTVE